MKTSIVTATLNAGPALLETARSVALQRPPVFEHVIQDGGSTDGSIEALRTLDLPGVAIRSEPDAGISDAFNRGIARCQGDLVGILNAGDTYTPRAIARAVAFFERHPEVAFVFGDMEFGANPPYLARGDRRYWRSIHRRMPQLNHPTVFVRRSAYLEHGGFDRSLRLAMDYDLLLRFHRRGLRGGYLPFIQARMASAGVSDHRWLAALREVREIAIRHGSTRCMASLWHAFYAARQALRRSAHRLVGPRLTSGLRHLTQGKNR